MKHRAGDRVEVAVTYLEMTARPGYPRPHLPTGPVSALIGAERPPAWYFLDLYDAVGRDYEWTDQRERPEAEVAAFLVSDASEWMRGEVVTFDGGEWLRGAGEFSDLLDLPDSAWEGLRKRRD